MIEDGTAPVSEMFSIMAAPVDDMPVFTSDPITSINEDSLYYYQVTAEDEDVGETAILSVDTIPDWLTFNASTGIMKERQQMMMLEIAILYCIQIQKQVW